MAYTVTEDLEKHYDEIRKARDWSWETLADYFALQTIDPASRALEAWAREQAEAEPAARSRRTAARETRGGDEPQE